MWPIGQRSEKAVLCGKCKHVLSVEEYMACGSMCTRCGAGFNPGCKGHWGMYFEMEGMGRARTSGNSDATCFPNAI